MTRPALRRRAVCGFGAFGMWWGAWGALVPAVQRAAVVSDRQLGTALLCVGLGALGSTRVTGALMIGYLGFVFAPALVGQLAGATTLPWALGALSVVALLLATGASRRPAPRDR